MRASSETIPATSAKNQFGRLLESAIQGRRIVITKHDVPKAILMSMDEYNALAGGPRPKLNVLTEEFDALLESMQTPKARAAMKRAFNASPKQLGRAAVEAARKRG
ncbi:MAG TPA: type II toxin-antitoxin system Phd/YefM family antitoxin [Candidatus Solibacter sp.]|nr:type II toxin-antitoxin system Phd/YefM family antitoxin [Candidatus Solibacter sp.]